jgi:hypothetical protein
MQRPYIIYIPYKIFGGVEDGEQCYLIFYSFIID